MNIEVLFQKLGLVAVGTNESSQIVNLQDPKGKPLQLNFDLTNGKCYMTVESWDDRNSIIRTFELDLPLDAWLMLLGTTFNQHIRPISKATYSEFDGLTELGVKLNGEIIIPPTS